MSDKPNKDYTDQRIKHLEMIQGAISRYLNFSAQVKNLTLLIGWTIFLGFMIGEMSMFSATQDSFGSKKIEGVLFLIVTLEAITLLCLLLEIQYFVRREAFRQFYDRVRAQPSDQRPDFCMTILSDTTTKVPLYRIAMLKSFRPTFLFYIVLLVYYASLIAVAFLLSHDVR